jgi:hypothetical protein
LAQIKSLGLCILFFIFDADKSLHMSPLIKNILFGIGAFSFFTGIAVLLKIYTNYKPVEPALFGLLTNSDLMLGVVVAFAVTFAHIRRQRQKK